MAETLKILIGEMDHKDLYARILQREGYKIQIASTKEEIINSYRIGDFDAVFIDLKVPSALEIITKLSDIPIVAISGDPSKESVALEHGASYFLKRPFDNLGEFQYAIVKAMARKAQSKFKAIA